MIKKIGILTSGGDAPGMNAAIRSVVRFAIKKGLEVFGIRRGYVGLITGDIIKMDERSVSDIIHKGGTILYTARCPEFKTMKGIAKAKKNCKKFKIEGLVVIGGDGSLRGAADLSSIGVSCIGIPGTIDNDIPCTDYTIGFDTAMNTAMELIDKLRDTSKSHNRISVVEVMGRNAGHIAINTGVACGATYVITQEIPYNIDNIANIMLKKKSNGQNNFVVIVSEGIGCSNNIAKFLQEKTGIEARATILGHVQRGGSPTILDRVKATRFGYYAVELLTSSVNNRVIGIKNNSFVDYDIHEALLMKKGYDKKLHNIAEEISF